MDCPPLTEDLIEDHNPLAWFVLVFKLGIRQTTDEPMILQICVHLSPNVDQYTSIESQWWRGLINNTTEM